MGTKKAEENNVTRERLLTQQARIILNRRIFHFLKRVLLKTTLAPRFVFVL